MLVVFFLAVFTTARNTDKEAQVGSVCGEGEEIESPNCPGMLANEWVQRNALATVYINIGCTAWKVKNADDTSGSLFLTAGHCGDQETMTAYYNYKTNCEGDGTGYEDAISCTVTRRGRNEDQDEYTLYEITSDCPHDETVDPILLDIAPPTPTEGIYIIGHPNGRPQFVSHQEVHDAGQHCEVRSFSDWYGDSQRVEYYCDTQGGNSGSPVFSSRSHHSFAIHTNGGCSGNQESENSGALIINIVDVLDSWGIPYVDSRDTDVDIDVVFIEQEQCAEFDSEDSYDSLNTETQADCDHFCENALSCVGYEWGQGCKVFYSNQIYNIMECDGEAMFLREGADLVVVTTTTRDPSWLHVEVSLHTSSWGSEVSWTLGDFCSGNGYTDNADFYIDECYAPEGTHDLMCIDSYGDGWHGGKITVNGVDYCAGFSSGSTETHSVTVSGGDSPVDPSDAPVPSDTPVNPTSPTDPTDSPVNPTSPTDPTDSPVNPTSPTDPTDSPVNPTSPTDPTDSPVNPTSPTDPTDGPVNPTSVDTTDSPVNPTSPTDPTDHPVNPTSVHTTMDTTMGSGDVTVQMTLHTAAWGSEISWTFGPCSSENEQYSDRSEYGMTCTVPPGAYVLNCIDSFGDGWHGGKIVIDGEEYCAGFTLGHSEEHCVNVGGTSDSCSNSAPVTTAQPTEPPCYNVQITVTTSMWGFFNSWQLIEGADADPVESTSCEAVMGDYGWFDEGETSCCLTEGAYSLYCMNLFGWGGWNGGSITINGDTYCNDFTDGNLFFLNFWFTPGSDTPPITPPGGGESCPSDGNYVGHCGQCTFSAQCPTDHYCCPYMKKCVASDDDPCSTPIANCQPMCYENQDSFYPESCSSCTNPNFPDNWVTCSSSSTAAESEVATIASQSVGPTSKWVYVLLAALAINIAVVIVFVQKLCVRHHEKAMNEHVALLLEDEI